VPYCTVNVKWVEAVKVLGLITFKYNEHFPFCAGTVLLHDVLTEQEKEAVLDLELGHNGNPLQVAVSVIVDSAGLQRV